MSGQHYQVSPLVELFILVFGICALNIVLGIYLWSKSKDLKDFSKHFPSADALRVGDG